MQRNHFRFYIEFGVKPSTYLASKWKESLRDFLPWCVSHKRLSEIIKQFRLSRKRLCFALHKKQSFAWFHIPWHTRLKDWQKPATELGAFLGKLMFMRWIAIVFLNDSVLVINVAGFEPTTSALWTLRHYTFNWFDSSRIIKLGK